MFEAQFASTAVLDAVVELPVVSLVENEIHWRRTDSVLDGSQSQKIIVGRWDDTTEGPHRLHAEPLTGYYTVDILLVETRVECFRNGKQISMGTVGFGSTQIAAPGEQIDCWFSRKTRAVHLFVPPQALIEAYEDVKQRDCPANFQLADPAYQVDHRLGQLASILGDAGDANSPFSVMYHDAMTTAMLARLLDTQTAPAVKRSSGLSSQLLRRATDFMEANLHQTISLEDIAVQTGLSRMYFASQFRRSTGLSPHTYLLTRRLERAKELLAADTPSLLDVAIAVGFQSQSHFTAVFRKLVGSTPGQWRAKATLHKSAEE
jgi:AraC family transcriptional regulator